MLMRINVLYVKKIKSVVEATTLISIPILSIMRQSFRITRIPIGGFFFNAENVIIRFITLDFQNLIIFAELVKRTLRFKTS